MVLRGRGKEMTAKERKQTLGMNGNIVYLDCDGIFTREQGPFTIEMVCLKLKY